MISTFNILYQRFREDKTEMCRECLGDGRKSYPIYIKGEKFHKYYECQNCGGKGRVDKPQK